MWQGWRLQRRNIPASPSQSHIPVIDLWTLGSQALGRGHGSLAQCLLSAWADLGLVLEWPWTPPIKGLPSYFDLLIIQKISMIYMRAPSKYLVAPTVAIPLLIV